MESIKQKKKWIKNVLYFDYVSSHILFKNGASTSAHLAVSLKGIYPSKALTLLHLVLNLKTTVEKLKLIVLTACW